MHLLVLVGPDWCHNHLVSSYQAFKKRKVFTVLTVLTDFKFLKNVDLRVFCDLTVLSHVKPFKTVNFFLKKRF
jgi:hypothetical protein